MACACAGLGAVQTPSFNYSSYLGLQQALNYIGIPDGSGRRLVEDGSMGPSTRAALVTMQQMAMIPADGQYGPQSQAALKTMVGQKAASLDVPVAPGKPGDPVVPVNPATPGGGGAPSVQPAAKPADYTMVYVAGAAVVLGVAAWFLLPKLTAKPGRR